MKPPGLIDKTDLAQKGKKALAHPSRHLFCEAKEMRELKNKIPQGGSLSAAGHKLPLTRGLLFLE